MQEEQINFEALDLDHISFRFSTSRGLQGPFDGGGVRNAMRSSADPVAK